LPLEDEIREIAGARNWDAVALVGPHGSGKTTALEHLQALLANEADLVFLDGPVIQQVVQHHRVIFTAPDKVPGLHGYRIYQLAPWTADEFIEYLLAAHKDRCASVMARLPAEDRGLFAGLPEVWRIILDQLATDESIQGAPAAFHQYLQGLLPDTDLVERARSACLNVLATVRSEEEAKVEEFSQPGFPQALLRLLRHRAVQVVLASERMAADLHGDGKCDYLAARLPRELVERTAATMFHDGKALDHLHQSLAGPSWSHAMAASILHATKTTPVSPIGLKELHGAYLDSIAWRGAPLAHADISEADLRSANLRGANLSRCNAYKADLSCAQLQRARLYQFAAVEADLSHADMSSANGCRALFDDADLKGATLNVADLKKASFRGARLERASFREANLNLADLQGAVIGEADFTAAKLQRADLSKLRLREATFAGAILDAADLRECDMEGMELHDAQFSWANLAGALLTGSVLRRAVLQGANLSDAKLAEVDWEGVDLRDADLTGASFHMGTSRSGLVGSPIACEGSKTGFYTDDYHDQYYKEPEEIRKANLCGADLRGAKIENVDFYLVDLRGAKFDKDQAAHLRSCGAILEARSL
jgi:uncharacterized protein YjbI with pentapeptide repeats/energy-coupling factor transporter ATP-binding protein EcfA2